MAAGQDTEVCWDTVGKGPGDLDRTVRKRKLTVSNLFFYILKTSQIMQYYQTLITVLQIRRKGNSDNLGIISQIST